MLKLQNLIKDYGKIHALNGLNMEVEAGALYGLVGPNGAGKTTTIRILTGILLPDSGSVSFAGTDVLREPWKLKEQVGYIPDEVGIYDNLKVWEYLDFFSSCYGLEGLKARKRAMTLLEQVGLAGKENFFVDALSRGMKQRLCLARALLHDPAVLIMDEPTAGLDPRTRMEFRDMLKELNESGKTILISSHNLSELAELCTDVGIIDEGRMVLHGSVNELIDRARTVKPLIITVQENMEKALEILKSNSKVRTVTIRDHEILAGFTGDSTQEGELLTALTLGGVLVRGFTRKAGNLETVFMELTNHDEERVVLSYDNESGV